MTKMIKLISAPLLSLVVLMGLTSAGHAETTVSAEVGFIFNTLLSRRPECTLGNVDRFHHEQEKVWCRHSKRDANDIAVS